MPLPSATISALLALGSQLVSLENNSHCEEKGYDILHSKLETLQQGVFPTQNIVWDVVQGIRYGMIMNVCIYIYIYSYLIKFDCETFWSTSTRILPWNFPSLECN